MIKTFDGQGWFLIDWSDASSEHSPRAREDNHGAEVDMWGIAKYMEESASRVTCRIAQPQAVQQMARRWMTDLATSAASVLDEINVRIFVSHKVDVLT